MAEDDNNVLTDSNPVSDSEENCLTADDAFSVFISYRVNPDQSLAIALRELIEGAIDPKPRVFVSGAGGLRPSSIGFKPQIQSAVQSARAFIAIITQQSKDREWIFFEAGAAFGRQQLYAPLLIDTAASDLASSIADYQAVRASSRDECERLISSIAETVDGKIKPRFGNRYRAFRGRVLAYNTTSDDESSEGNRSPLGQAVDMLRSGELEEAARQFDELESSVEDSEMKATVRIAQVVNSSLPHAQLLQSLEKIEKDLGPTAASQYWLGVYENRPPAAVRHYEQCLKLLPPEGDEAIRSFAIVAIAEETYRAADHEVAYACFRDALKDDSRTLRAKATIAWSQLPHTPDAIEKLLIVSLGLLDDPESTVMLRELVELCREEEWHELMIYLARRAGTHTGSTANDLGRAYVELNLPSLAYLAFSDSADLGVTVAKVNMALETNWTAPVFEFSGINHGVLRYQLQVMQDLIV